MKYLIHTCPKREWYVNDHLIPLLTEQGIAKNDIKVWNDKNTAGNLKSFVASCEWIGKNYDLKESTWHLQDDIVVSKRFVKEAEKPHSGFKNGFCNEIFDGERTNYIGNTTVNGMWFSFQCIAHSRNKLSSHLPVDTYSGYNPFGMHSSLNHFAKSAATMFGMRMHWNENHMPFTVVLPI